MFRFLTAHKKILGIGALVIVIGASFYAWNQNTYQRGVLDERMRLSDEYARVLEQQRQEYEIASQRATQLFEQELEEELARARAQVETQVEIKEVVRYVETEIEVPADCTQLADNVSRVLKQATDIIRRATITDTTDTN